MFVVGMFIGIIGIIISILLLSIGINKSKAELKGCRNCKHMWDDCAGNFVCYCEEWEKK